jgi:nitroimidazol reductase NimA-like FMN-containing flavoprotein (pyridoxamine 5'-phosphate oxidase superfamily)
MIIEELATGDCLGRLARAGLARLACARGNQPYIVPTYFAYHEPYLYGFTTPGQKVEWMRANPLVCVEVDDVSGRDEWTSVVAFGRYEELPDTPEWGAERLHAHGLLQERGRWWEPGCASRTQLDPGQAPVPVFYRIRISHVSGRRARPDRVGPESTGPAHPAGERRGRLRGFLMLFRRF